MKSADKICINNVYLMTLKYNVYENDHMNKIICEFNDNLKLYDPYLIALSLMDFDMSIINTIKDHLNNKKILQYYRNDIPYEDLLYSLTGGDDVWKDNKIKVEWNYEKALSFWKNELDEITKDCFTLYDLIIAFKYLKNEIIFRHYSEFLKKL